MSKELDIRFSPRSLVNPYRPLIVWGWGNKQYARWAKEAGYSSMEFCPFWRPTAEILLTSGEINKDLPQIKSVCAGSFNPYAHLKAILGEESDPLHPEQHFFRSRVIYSTPFHARKAIRKLESQLPGVQTVTDPEVADKFTCSLIYHDSNGESYPHFGNLASNLEGLNNNLLEKLLEEGALKQVRLNSTPNLRGIIDGQKRDSNWAKKISLVKQANSTIPIVVDITVEELARSGAITRRDMFIYGPKCNPQYWHHKITDFIRAI